MVHQIFRCHRGIGNTGVVFKIGGELKILEKGQQVLVHHAAHRAANASSVCLFVAVSDEDFSHDSPLSAVGCAAGAASAFHHRVPMRRDVGGTEIEAQGYEPAFAGQLQCV